MICLLLFFRFLLLLLLLRRRRRRRCPYITYVADLVLKTNYLCIVYFVFLVTIIIIILTGFPFGIDKNWTRQQRQTIEVIKQKVHEQLPVLLMSALRLNTRNTIFHILFNVALWIMMFRHAAGIMYLVSDNHCRKRLGESGLPNLHRWVLQQPTSKKKEAGGGGLFLLSIFCRAATFVASDWALAIK